METSCSKDILNIATKRKAAGTELLHLCIFASEPWTIYIPYICLIVCYIPGLLNIRVARVCCLNLELWHLWIEQSPLWKNCWFGASWVVNWSMARECCLIFQHWRNLHVGPWQLWRCCAALQTVSLVFVIIFGVNFVRMMGWVLHRRSILFLVYAFSFYLSVNTVYVYAVWAAINISARPL